MPKKLEVEDEEARESRISDLLSKLNSTSRPQQTPQQFELGSGSRPTIQAVDPPTDVLARVQAFLPQLEASNADLLRRARENPESVDIENISERAESHVEMNLGLGVFEDRSKVPASDQTMSDSSSDSEEDDSSGSSSDSSSSSEDVDSDSDSDSDISMANGSARNTRSRPIKPLPKRAAGAPHPGIVVLDSKSTVPENES